MVEKMLDRLPTRKCVHYPECSFQRIDHQAVLDHEEDCSHRKAPCGICGHSVAMSNLNNHLKGEHGDLPSKNFKYWELRYTVETQKMLHGFLGDQFYFNKMCLNDNNMMLWVSYNGSRKDNRKYQFSIEVVNEDDQMVLSCTKFCVPCDMSRDIIRDKFLGVVINKDLAQEISTGGDGEIDNDPIFKANIQFFLATRDDSPGRRQPPTNQYERCEQPTRDLRREPRIWGRESRSTNFRRVPRAFETLENRER